jgi:hypothetical protein
VGPGRCRGRVTGRTTPPTARWTRLRGGGAALVPPQRRGASRRVLHAPGRLARAARARRRGRNAGQRPGRPVRVPPVPPEHEEDAAAVAAAPARRTWSWWRWQSRSGRQTLLWWWRWAAEGFDLAASGLGLLCRRSVRRTRPWSVVAAAPARRTRPWWRWPAQGGRGHGGVRWRD